MSAAEMQALEALTFNWTSALDDVWRPSPYHVEGLHAEAAGLIRRGIDAAAGATERANPLGLPLLGQRGVGKTHLLGWARVQVQAAGGYFFLLGDLTRKTFWDEARTAVVQQLQPLRDGSRDQLGRLLSDLADHAGVDKPVRAAVTGAVPPTPADVTAFIAALRGLSTELAPPCLDTARALVLLASPEPEHSDLGYYYLEAGDIDSTELRPWGIRTKPKKARFVINQVSQLLALSGPAVVAVDQIDALIDEVNKGTDARVVAEVGTGLMDLRDTTHRTFTIISCLPESWDYVRSHAVDSVQDRFSRPCQMQNIPTADIGRLMIEKRFAADYARVGFEPPYSTWPILPGAFTDAVDYTARALLKRIDAHVSECLRAGRVVELDRLSSDRIEPAAGTELAAQGPLAAGQPLAADQPSAPGGEPSADQDFAALDASFRELWDSADVSAALVPGTEDALMPELLDAGLEAWIRERGDADDRAFIRERQPRKNPALHAELRMIIDDRTERQRRWAFRAISAENALAFLSRLRNAVKTVGLDPDTANRQLFVVRSTPWPNGKKTQEERADFLTRGGVTVPATVADLKTLAALRVLLAGRRPALNDWLAKRRPAHGTELLAAALGDVAPPGPSAAARSEVPKTRDPLEAPYLAGPADSPAMPSPGSFCIGTSMKGQSPVCLDLEVLRRHAVLFAGSGSGKTVLLRRIIEECALQGVSSIVLDPNNDLARLGDGWPARPPYWSNGDAERSADYLTNTDVVIWTPRRQAGRLLTFRPLPEFRDVRDDPDELAAAIDGAVGAMAPRLIAGKGPIKAEEEKAVLREALGYFAEAGGSEFDGFLALLSELPEGACSLRNARATAADLAHRLRVARINDPLFAGEGEPADPGMLLTPPPGKRARVSVISLIGLPEAEQRQAFVNQLQMALFSWIKKHPAADRPLGGLLVMDEAQELAPSDKATACLASTIQLASQARKYGLGLLFATQAPKSLHNRIPGNATTQFYGLLSSPVQIDAARDLAHAKGGDVPDIGRLPAGQFYVATEGTGFVKTATPMCLTYHPRSALTEEEVIARTRRLLS
ncbi:MAG TPA: DUF87 domain-containing protein [Trebonia sp.]